MTKEYVDGFMEAARNAGLNEKQAAELFVKKANHPGAGGPPPQAGGIPPELEQLLSTPEGVQLLMQLVQQIEQQQGGPAGHADTGIEPGGMAPQPGADDGAGAPPAPEEQAMQQAMMQQKQGEANYIEGFLKAAIEYGFTEGQSIDIYKEAMKNKANVKNVAPAKMKAFGKRK